jgi:uncharacterized phage protein (TIGR01671 family)
MRELKFRAWYKPEKKMIYNIQKEFEERIELGMDCFSDYLNNDDFIVEQYTGLKDKNGRKIYEGDVIECVFNVREAEVSVIGEVCIFEGQGAYGIKNVKYNNQELRRLCDKENEYAGEIFCFAGYDNTDEDQTLIFTDYCFIEDDLEVLGNIHENPELLEK